MKRLMIDLGALALAALAIETASSADLAITNARVFTATDAGVLEQATVVIAGGRIASISTGTPYTGSGEVIDAAGRMVLPGLIDAHLHVFFDSASVDGSVTQRYFPKSDAQASAYIRGPMHERLKSYLEQGFTSVVSPIDFWPHVIEARELIDSGELRGPRLFVAGGAFTGPGDYFVCVGLQGDEKAWCNEHLMAPFDRAGQARELVRRYAESGVDFIAFDSLSPNVPSLVIEPPKLERDAVKAMIDEAHQQGLRVFLSNHSALHVNDFVAWGVDGLFKGPRTVRDEDGSLLQSAGAAGLPLVLPLGNTEERYRLSTASENAIQNYRIERANALTLLEHGAVPVFGADLGDKTGTTPGDVLRITIQAMYGVGLSREEILMAATRNAAQALLGRHDLGTLEPGQLADAIIVDGDPLIDLDALLNVKVVIKNGELVVDRR